MSLRGVAHPPWIRSAPGAGDGYKRVRATLHQLGLHTVCEEARCPNRGECWSHGTATFIIMGDVCTRRCHFCAVRKGEPAPLDPAEPRRVADAVWQLGLEYVVLTSVDRDDLPDQGAEHFAATVEAIHRRCPQCRVEALIPDFGRAGVARILTTAIVVLGHNIETVPRLYRRVRPGSDYERSLRVISTAKELRRDVLTKSGLMLGLGETNAEVLAVAADLRAHGCDILTLGQYLRPSARQLPVARYVTPEEFDELKTAALKLGFRHVESAPLVRSSYHAWRQLQ
ncbi:MAG: lipoyl synthase [Verrucomicrobiae bacterium]|nr:lipoyl synthase [Verrucomicrobiae bacterium]